MMEDEILYDEIRGDIEYEKILEAKAQDIEEMYTDMY